MNKNNVAENEDWQYTQQDHEEAQLRGWLTSTPTQRLAWLEEAIVIAHNSGALAKYHADRHSGE
jgi:hypothetical protein